MDSKVLVIGLGGIGSEIVCNLEKGRNKVGKGNVQFAIMDTDVNTISAMKRRGFAGKIVSVSNRMTVGEYLEKNEDANRWFLNNNILSWKPVSEGAGQIRAVSRLALEQAIKDDKLRPLYEAIRELHIPVLEDPDTENSAFRIIIVSTLAGGTGSGIVLPLAIHLRQFLMDNYKRKDVIIRGIFLLADCLDMVVGSEAERKSLRSNTYAAVKELDAFMKKGDGYLGEKYRYISLKPVSDTGDVPIISYNYCYLFSARDAAKNELLSFQELKDNVMRCIYAQILGPMQELNNSIEDNVLKSTMTVPHDPENIEFNRYCAAGLRILEYPYEHILNYLSIQKMANVFSEQWLEIDIAYREEMEKQEKKEKEGFYIQKAKLGDFYINYITNSNGGSPLIAQIKDEMGMSGKGKWEEYLECLDKSIKELIRKHSSEWQDEEDWCRNRIRSIRELRSERSRMSLNKLEENWSKLSEKYGSEVERIQSGLESKYFKICEKSQIPKEHFYYWLRDEDELLHMSSVRYFLYRTIRAFEEKRDEAEKEKKEYKKKLEGAENLKKKIHEKENVWPSWLHGQFFYEVCDEYEKNINNLEKFYENEIRCRVYLLGIENLKKLSNIIEKFYGSFDDNQEIFLQKKRDIYDQIMQKRSRTLRYVGMNQDYLDKVIKMVTDYERDSETNRKLSENIFEKLWRMSVQDKEDWNQPIKDIFQKDCIDFWKNNLRENYDQELNLNIVEALLKEGEQLFDVERKYAHLERTLDSIWELTAPYLQIESAGSSGQTKKFCTYHSDIFTDNDRVNQILGRYLVQNGGVDGAGEVDKYTLIFYKVVYNLRAVDIMDFSAGSWNDEKNLKRYFSLDMFPENCGTTFKNYYETINIQDATKLTPHIDKNWSNIFKMPDINPSYTIRRERQIYQAFWTMWLEGIIEVPEPSELPESSGPSKKSGYTYTIDKEAKNTGTLKLALEEISEHKLEMMDALKWLINRVEEDCSVGKNYSDSNIASFVERKSYNIFWVPYTYLCELAAPQWDHEMLNNMLKAIWDLLEMVMKQFDMDGEWSTEFNKLVEQGYRKLKIKGIEGQSAKQNQCKRAAELCRYFLKDICRRKENSILLKTLTKIDREG